MSNSMDITLLPIFRSVGKDQTELPGLYIAEPPRRAARSRRSDHLILYLSLTGNDPISTGKQEQILSRLGHTFFKTSGSVTSALRTVAETLNKFLLDRNVKSASSGRQTIGLLTLVAVRSEQFFMAQSGPVHAFWITAGEIQHLFDPQLSGRGLGLSRTTPIRYFQASMKPGDTGAHGQRLESLHRRLLHRSDTELNALLLQTQPGSGNVHLHRPVVTPGAAPEERASEGQLVVEESGRTWELPEELAPSEAPQLVLGASAQDQEQAELDIPQEIDSGEEPEDTGLPNSGSAQFSAQPTEEVVVSESPVIRPVRPLSDPVPSAEAVGTDQTSPAVIFESKEIAEPVARAPRRISFRPVVKALGVVVGAVATTVTWFLGGVSTLLRRMLPDEAMFSIPTTTMAFIAVAVPLVVVAIATMVYFQRGRAAQYDAYYNQAVVAAQQAAAQDDIQVRREVWNEILTYLDAAENYRVTAESRQLRAEIQSRLDDLELIKRVDFQPAIVGGLPDSVQVSRMILSDGELFLLDAASGNVLRTRITTSQDYDLERSFQCGPEYAGGYGVEKLIDVAPAPLGNSAGALVFAMDKNGSLLSCFPGDAPAPQTLTRPATAPNWGNLVAFTVDQDTGDIYVLDPLDQAVWVYWGGDVSVDPEFFFGEEVPMMEDMIDLTVDKGDLYLLHADGHTTMCTYSTWDVSPTRCVEPMPYVDSRPGKEGQSLEVDQAFLQVLSTQPPDPSLYLLQPQTQAIYHFSLRTLNYHRQFMPHELLAGKPASAMAVNQLERMLFLAVDNQVFRASMP
ncbi:MAG: hypothetical protein P8074_27530 [Anaerolineales bacterium]